MSLKINHPNNTIKSSDAMTINVLGGTTSLPHSLTINASSIVVPVAEQPSGVLGSLYLDSSSNALRYFNGASWVSILSKDVINQDILNDITNIQTELGTKVDSVTYATGSVPTASISGTELSIIFPQSSTTDTPSGLYTSQPQGSISYYSLTSGQTYASIREQLGGSSGSQSSNLGTSSSPYITATGWCLADGNYWKWTGTSTQLIQVPNLNQSLYLKSLSTSGVTNTNTISQSTGSISSTTIEFPQHYHGTGAFAGSYGSKADDIALIRRQWNNSEVYPSLTSTGNSDYRISGTISGSDSNVATGTSNAIYVDSDSNSHTHNVSGLDVTHATVAVLYNIAIPQVALNQTAANNLYVLKSGDTMTGTLSVSNILTLKSNSTYDSQRLDFWFRDSSGNERAVIYHNSVDNTLRLRANAGSELTLNSSGVLQTNTLSSNTGYITNLGVSGTLTTNAAQVNGALNVTGWTNATGATFTSNVTVQGASVVRSVNGNYADANGAVSIASTSASLQQNGWWEDNHTGYIRQWGYISWSNMTHFNSAEGYAIINLPRNFPSAGFNGSATLKSTTPSATCDVWAQVISVSSSQIIVQMQNAGQQSFDNIDGIFWSADGY